MRRNEVLGLQWPDIDTAKNRLHLSRGLVAVGYEIHHTRGKTKTARRAIALDDTTIAVLEGWRAYQAAEFVAERLANPTPTGKKKATKRSRETPVERRGNNRQNAA